MKVRIFETLFNGQSPKSSTQALENVSVPFFSHYHAFDAGAACAVALATFTATFTAAFAAKHAHDSINMRRLMLAFVIIFQSFSLPNEDFGRRNKRGNPDFE